MEYNLQIAKNNERKTYRLKSKFTNHNNNLYLRC